MAAIWGNCVETIHYRQHRIFATGNRVSDPAISNSQPHISINVGQF